MSIAESAKTGHIPAKFRPFFSESRISRRFFSDRGWISEESVSRADLHGARSDPVPSASKLARFGYFD
jgi:hypothetical protein